jgi:hypothetical protein
MTYVRYLVTDVQKAVDFYSTHLGAYDSATRSYRALAGSRS